jgi:hypothetical protein
MFQNLRTVRRGLAAAIAVSAPLLITPPPASAQTVDVTVRGIVLDESRAAMPGATVSATNTATGLVRQAVADTAGLYVIGSLPAGTYDVQAELQGFTTQIRRQQELHVGTTITLDFTLSVGALSETIEVKGDAPILETTKNTLSRIVQPQELDNLPVISRSFSDLAALAPGVVRTGAGIEITGSRDFQNGMRLDGISAARNQLGSQRIQYAQDWIQEFQVMTNQVAAEFGGASGGMLNAISRSGTNRYTSRAYGFFRNGAWDALPAFATTKPPLDQERFGVLSGGPIQQNHLFYFVGIERLDNNANVFVTSAFPQSNGTFPAVTTQTLGMAKVDDQINASNRVQVRFNSQRQLNTNNGVGGTSTLEHGNSTSNPGTDTVGEWLSTLKPNLLNEARAAYTTFSTTTTCNFSTNNPPGTWFERNYPGGSFGCSTLLGQLIENQFSANDTLSWVRGAHQVKAGFQWFGVRRESTSRQTRDGQYRFDRDILFDINNPASYPSAFNILDGPVGFSLFGASWGTFVQDSWSAANNVTVNLGLRYDVDGQLDTLNQFLLNGKGLHPLAKDKNNLSPRAGIAWTPFNDNKRTLIRAGGGIYYDEEHVNMVGLMMSTLIQVDHSYRIDANVSSFNPFFPDTTRAKALLAAAYAQNAIPNLAGLPTQIATVTDVAPHAQIPNTAQVTGGLAHDFQHGINVSADVVYSNGRDQYLQRDVNLNPVNFTRINPAYGAINQFTNEGWFRERALLVSAGFAPNPRQSIRLAYTLAKNVSNTSTALTGGTATNPLDLSVDEGPANNDVRHVLSVSGATLMPFGVQLAVIGSYRSAFPYSATTTLANPNGTPVGWRPEPRNARRGDSFTSIDARLSKVVRFSQRFSVTGFAEVFNLTNALNYTSYVGTVTSALFGQATAADAKRRVQLGFRVDF